MVGKQGSPTPCSLELERVCAETRYRLLANSADSGLQTLVRTKLFSDEPV
jgi:hypothetical protein